MAATLAYVNPEVLRWAREAMGYTTHEAASELRVDTWKLEAAEQGYELLTLRQAEKLAAVYDPPAGDVLHVGAAAGSASRGAIPPPSRHA